MVASEPITDNASTKTLVEFYQNGVSALKGDRNKAFIILTYRFRGEVLKKCEILCNRYGHDVNAAELITFKTFDSYARKGQFSEAKSKGKTYDESFLIYLLGIAERELINYYRDLERKRKNPYDGTEQLYHELPEVPARLKLDMKMEIEFNVIKSLSSKHRTIYLTYKVHQRQGFKMPRKLLMLLRKQLDDISQNTVNAYLKEARDEVAKAHNTYQLTENIKSNGK